MQALARSDMDDAFTAVRKLIGPKRLFTGAQVRAAVAMEIGDSMPIEDVRRWVTRRLRAEATQVEEYQTVKGVGHHKILHWRGVDCRWVTHGDMARSAVEQTATVIARHYSDDSDRGPFAGTVVDIKRPPTEEK